MLLRKFKRDIPTALLAFFVSKLPDERRPWAEAILAEGEAVPEGRERLSWALSGSWGLAKIWLNGIMRRFLVVEATPLPVVLICAYHAIFCCVLLFVIVSQIPRITSPWTEAFFPILFFVLAALIPGVIALGLWVLDDFARYLAIFLALLQGLGNCALVSYGHPWSVRLVARIVLDILIGVILLSRSVKRAFKPPSIQLTLDER